MHELDERRVMRLDVCLFTWRWAFAPGRAGRPSRFRGIPRHRRSWPRGKSVMAIESRSASMYGSRAVLEIEHPCSSGPEVCSGSVTHVDRTSRSQVLFPCLRTGIRPLQITLAYLLVNSPQTPSVLRFSCPEFQTAWSSPVVFPDGDPRSLETLSGHLRSWIPPGFGTVDWTCPGFGTADAGKFFCPPSDVLVFDVRPVVKPRGVFSSSIPQLPDTPADVPGLRSSSGCETWTPHR